MRAVTQSGFAVALALSWCACGGPRERVGPGDAGVAEAADDGAPAPPCRAGARTCIGNAPSECSADGTWLTEPEACAELCDPNLGCVADDPCARAAAEGSYIGCRYWAAPLPNDPSPHLHELFDFRIVVANAGAESARVTAKRSGTVVATADVLPNTAESIVLPWIAELSSGVANVGGGPGEPEPSWTSLVVPGGAYEIESDRPVVVYQFNPFDYSTAPTPEEPARYSYSNDASLLLPVHALGDRYRGLTFQPQSMQWDDPRIAGPIVNAHPGYLAVIGTTEEPTEVTVVPTAPIAAAPDGRFGAVEAGEELRFSIARGEVVVLMDPPPPRCDPTRPGYRHVEPSATGLQADELCSEREYDLTGTRIDSSAPIAVFGGHVCAFVPYDVWACDHLETQVPPATTLGREMVATPLVDTLLPSAPEMSLLRVVGVVDGTTVAIEPPVGDVSTFTLDDGDVRELVIREPHRISASTGVLAGEYLVGQLADGVESEARRGDPAMLTLPPVEQYRDDYLFVTPTSYDVVPSFPGDPPGQSFVVVIRPAGAEVRLDGELLDGEWTTVGEQQVGTFPLMGGSHHLESAARFGALVYGLGRHTSYAYPGGLDLEPILLI